MRFYNEARAGFGHRDAGSNTSDREYNRFPYCHLHGHQIVDKFPPSCALAAENPLAALFQVKKAAFREVDYVMQGLDSHVIETFGRYDTCYECVDKNPTSPTVRRLRGMRKQVTDQQDRPIVGAGQVVSRRVARGQL